MNSTILIHDCSFCNIFNEFLMSCFLLFSSYFGQMVRKCSTVICTLQKSQIFEFDFVIRYSWVRFVRPILSLVITDRSFLFNDVVDVLSVTLLRTSWMVVGFDVFYFLFQAFFIFSMIQFWRSLQ